MAESLWYAPRESASTSVVSADETTWMSDDRAWPGEQENPANPFRHCPYNPWGRKSIVKDPIDHLLGEHREIMAEIDALRRAAEDLRQRGHLALSSALPVFEAVGRMMSTKLALHARKEDDILFSAIERAMGTSQGPTSVMRQEHSVIHDRVRVLGETLRELHEIEHPAIVAAGERLGRLADAGAAPAALAESADTIVQLLDLHFSKEEMMLFPMARDILSDAEMGEVAVRMAAFSEDADPC